MSLIASKFDSPPRGRIWLIGAALGWGLALVFLAGVVHIATILLIPRYSATDAWSRAAGIAGSDTWTVLPQADADAAVFPGLDPLFVHGLCKIAVEEVPALLSLEASDRFWSMALYDNTATVIFSLNDRTAVDGALEMLVVNPIDAERLKESRPADLEGLIIVESATPELIALLRIYAPKADDRADAVEQIKAAQCTASPIVTEG